MFNDKGSVGVVKLEGEVHDVSDDANAASTDGTSKQATTTEEWSLPDDVFRKAVDALFQSVENHNRRKSLRTNTATATKGGAHDDSGTVPLLEEPMGQELSFFLQFTFKTAPRRNLLRPITMYVDLLNPCVNYATDRTSVLFDINVVLLRLN